MTVPLWVLAIGAILVGLVGLPVGVFGKGRHLLERALAPALPHVEHAEHAAEGHGGHHLATEIGLMVVSLCVALVGIWWAWTWYHKKRGEPAARLAARAPWLYRALWNRWWVDEIYWGLVLHPYRRMCGWLDRFDAGVVDGTIRLSGLMTEMTSLTLRFVQTGRLRTYAFFLLIGAVLLLGYLLLVG